MRAVVAAGGSRLAELFAPRDLGSRDNALNMLRLVLASLVVFSHVHILSGTGDGVMWEGQHLGSWAVVGFFTISGFLITGARCRSKAGTYLINRVVRIFPGYLLVLVLVAFGLAPIAQVAEHGSLDGYLSTPVTPVQYIWVNSLLTMGSYSIGETLTTSPYGTAWNGSLWSLYYEFMCYIVIGVFMSWRWTRERAWPVIALFVLSVLVHAGIDRISPYTGGDGSLALFIFMFPYFMGGAVIYVLRDRLPMRAWIALLAAIISYALIALLPDVGKQAASPFMAYLILWLGAVLPSPRVTRVHDISYGVYIFHFPLTQLLLVSVGAHWGFTTLLVVVMACTLVLATLSWVLVERAAMRWSRGRSPWAELSLHA